MLSSYPCLHLPFKAPRAVFRYQTAARISERSEQPARQVIIARADQDATPDALVAGTLAHAEGATLLFTEATELPDLTREEIQR